MMSHLWQVRGVISRQLGCSRCGQLPREVPVLVCPLYHLTCTACHAHNTHRCEIGTSAGVYCSTWETFLLL